MKVLYVANNRTNTVTNYQASLDGFGYDHQILGFGEKGEGWQYRIKKYRDACALVKPTDIIVFTDADDVLACREPQDLVEQFKSFNQPIVISSEQICTNNCVEPVSYWAHQPMLAVSNRYVNAGLIVGYASSLSTMWQWILKASPPFFDDQVGLGYYVNEFYDKVALDWKNQLFYNLRSRDELPQMEWVRNGSGNRHKLVTLLDKTYGKISPHFLHFPDSSSLVYDRITDRILGEAAIQALDMQQDTASWYLYSVILSLTIILLILIIVSAVIIKRITKKEWRIR